MNKIQISKSNIYYNTTKYDKGGALSVFINSEKLSKLVTKLENIINTGCNIVLGGDGTLLKVIQEEYNSDLPTLGVNFGTKGFLLHSLEDINNSTGFHSQKYPLLHCEIQMGEETIIHTAFNEIDIRASTGKIIELDIALSGAGNGRDVVTNLKGDGLVFSTPAGSTGYNFSLGGPIIPHELKSFVLTPKAPWLPRYFKSVLVNNSKTVTIKNTGRLSDIKIVCDGTDICEIKDNNITIIITKSTDEIELLIPNSQEVSWEDKIFLEQSFR